MTSGGEYGSLSDRDYYRLLEELQSDTEDLARDLAEADREAEDPEPETSPGTRPPKSVKTVAETTRLIKQMAFDQANIRLDAYIGTVNTRRLLTILSRGLQKRIEVCEKFINKRITRLLGPLIPGDLIDCYVQYPASFITAPGFFYQPEGYPDKPFWATPDLPYYFRQGTEQEVLAEFGEAFLGAIDETVLKYYDLGAQKAKREEKNAAYLIQKNILTYFDLLRTRPFWFKFLYEDLTCTKLI